MLEVGSVAGSSIEILDTRKRFGGPQTLRQVILEDVGSLCIPTAPAWRLGKKTIGGHQEEQGAARTEVQPCLHQLQLWFSEAKM